jgi:signal transduction histidine kinase
LEEVRADLDRIREQDVREVSHLLHPAVISIGLVPALRRLGMDLRGAADVMVDISSELESFDDIGEGRIPEPVRLAIYRTVEEAITNALKHGDATSIAITALVEGDEIVVTTTDNGCGFDVNTITPGLGMTTTTSRLARLGGTHELHSTPGVGSTVMARVPLSGAANHAAATSEPTKVGRNA